jgi:hypothetical protein
MNAPLVLCTKCNASLLGDVFNTGALESCPGCGASSQVELFPALFRATTPGDAGETILTEGEAGCFYHPQKRAIIPCHACGRFLCGLCDVEWHGQHLCPACLESGSRKGKLTSLENHRILYDSAALSVAILPILFWPLTVFTAPMAVFMGFRYWNAPSSIIPRTKIRLVLAIIIGLIQIVLWGWLIYYLATQ